MISRQQTTMQNHPVGRELRTQTVSRPLVKSAYQKINFLISQPKRMLWVLKSTISMRRFF